MLSTVCNSGFFSFLTIKNNAAVNVCAQVGLWVSAFSSHGYRPWSGIAGSYGNSMFNFWGAFKLFSKVVAPFCIPPSYARIPTLITAILMGVKRYLPVWFWFAFSWWLMMLSTFSSVYWPYVYLLWRNLYSYLCSFLNWVICVFVVEVKHHVTGLLHEWSYVCRIV